MAEEEKQINLRIDQPFKSEYAKSSRASCRACKGSIQKEELRLAKMVRNPRFDGVSPHWFHFDCFFQKNKPKSTGDIAHFSELKYEDQKQIEEHISTTGGIVATGDFKLEYSKSARAACVLCEVKINKQELRVGKLDQESDLAYKLNSSVYRWFHLDCFSQSRDDAGFFDSGDKIPGYEDLEPEDQRLVKRKLPKTSVKRKGPTEKRNDAKKSKNDVQFEKKMKLQSDQYYQILDNLKSLKPKEIDLLLEKNKIKPSHDKLKKLERIADGMLFGVPTPCPQCLGQLYFHIMAYLCDGYPDEWGRCSFQTEKPDRTLFKVPKELKEKYDFFSNYKSQKIDRIIPKVQAPIASVDPTEEALDPQPETADGESEKKTDPKKPLQGHKVSLLGKLSQSTRDLKKQITELGAKHVVNFDRTVLFVVATRESFEKEMEEETDRILDARDLAIIVVDEKVLKVLNDSSPDEVPAILLKHALSDWGKEEIEKRFINLVRTDKVKSFKSGKSGANGLEKSGTQKVVIKDGAAVDPASGLQDIAIVLRENGDLYSITLNQVDIVKNKNSYYKIQVLQHETSKDDFWVFYAWGRIGTSVGGSKIEGYNDKKKAIERFKELFLTKTKNEWEDRNDFRRYANMYYPVDICYSTISQNVSLKIDSQSDLPKAIQQLIIMLFDVNLMQREMKEFEIDLDKLPLGKLSKKQIMEAYTVLNEIYSLLGGGDSKSEDTNGKPVTVSNKLKTKLLSKSEKFFSLIPHSFGQDRVQIVSNVKTISTKRKMLDALMDIEVAYEMMSSVKTEKDEGGDVLMQHYLKLHADISIVEPDDPINKLITEYVTNTHAKTHRQYKLKILDVFKIVREGEDARYKTKSEKLANKMLLWHGSRVTNFASIISQGLKIAPPEAPSTGYMFGKGVYFSDLVSKSANYCFPETNDNIGLLILSEVALGEMHELTHAEFITTLPEGKHSVKGLGKTAPDPAKNKKIDGDVEVPCGPPVPTGLKNSDLLYNEYIVYDISQIKLRYLLKVEFVPNM